MTDEVISIFHISIPTLCTTRHVSHHVTVAMGTTYRERESDSDGLCGVMWLRAPFDGLKIFN